MYTFMWIIILDLFTGSRAIRHIHISDAIYIYN